MDVDILLENEVGEVVALVEIELSEGTDGVDVGKELQFDQNPGFVQNSGGKGNALLVSEGTAASSFRVGYSIKLELAWP